MRVRLVLEVWRTEQSVGRAERDEILEAAKAAVDGLEFTAAGVVYACRVARYDT